MQPVHSRPLLDTSEQQPVYLLAGRRGAYIRLSQSAYCLLERVRLGESFAAIAATLSSPGAPLVSAEAVESVYRRLCRRIAAIEERRSPRAGGFWLQWQLLPAAAVRAMAARLTWAFHPLSAVLLSGLILAGVWVAWRSGLQASDEHFFSAYALFLLSLFCHELGHASACMRYGAAPSEIGLTVYLIYPAFYSNVDAAWTLRRWQRMVVDLAGVYFQLIFGAVCALAMACSQLMPLRLCLVFIAGSCLMSLNPILKFDGYWLMSDALGVTNLGRQPARIYRYLLARLRGGEPQPLPWSPRVLALLSVYAVVSTGFWLLFVSRLIPALFSYAGSYPHVVQGLVAELRRPAAWPRWAALQPFFASTYMLIFLVLVLAQLARNLLRHLRGLVLARRAAKISCNQRLARA